MYKGGLVTNVVAFLAVYLVEVRASLLITRSGVHIVARGLQLFNLLQTVSGLTIFLPRDGNIYSTYMVLIRIRSAALTCRERRKRKKRKVEVDKGMRVRPIVVAPIALLLFGLIGFSTILQVHMCT